MAIKKGPKRAIVKPSRQYEGVSEDEIETFNARRERIPLDESEDDARGRYSLSEDEAVMGLPSSEEEQEEEQENDDDSWGKRKTTFYSADVAAEDLEEEAAEARKMQRRKMKTMKPEDFIPGKRVIRTDKSGPIKIDLSEEEEQDEEGEQEGDRFVLEGDFAHLKAESLEDLLPSKEQLDLQKKHAPELQTFLAEFRRKSDELRTQLEPLLRQLEGESLKEEGLSFLTTKYQLLLGYCANLAHYMALKVGAKTRVENHPVIERLIKYRLLIEKIRPLESKMQYQIDKLLAHSKTSINVGGLAKAQHGSGDSALAYRPNPSTFLPDSDQEAEEEHDDEQVNGDGKYKAPRIAPMHYEGDKETKRHKMERREQTSGMRSRLLKDLQAELEEQPEEESIDPAYAFATSSLKDSISAKRSQYEEENFMRFVLNKKERQQMDGDDEERRPIDELEDLDAFVHEIEKTPKPRTNISKLLGMGKRAKKGHNLGGDDDNLVVSSSKKERKSVNSKRDYEEESDDDHYKNDDDGSISEVEDDMEGENEFYRSAMRHQRDKKQAKTSNTINRRPSRPFSDLAPGQDRPANYQIMANKGLTPRRPKDVRNPRVNRRNKWDRAQKRIKSLRPSASAPINRYSGEATGIRTNISRSAKF